MTDLGGFHDLLFEMSNEYRYNILLLLREKVMRISDLTREIKFTTAEVRRHVTRLAEVGLIQRDIDGYYQLTPYGETSLLLFQEFIFLSTNREYFKTHTLSKIPTGFVKQIGELSASNNLADAMDFLRHTENLFKESEEYVWLLVDQFPMNSLSSIVEAIERGVQFRIIEPRERILNPDIESMTSEETQALSRTRQTPLVDQRMVDEVNVHLFLSDNRSIIAFPTTDGQYDYKGFTATGGSSLKWCRELFLYFWNEATQRTPAPVVEVKRGQISKVEGSSSQTVVIGCGRPELDAKAIQEAVDNYDKVVLKGWFNIGTSTININRSVIIRGEGRTDDVPDTKIRKKGWKFPFLTLEFMFIVRGEDIDVTIENIHVMDFNGVCIFTFKGNSVTIRRNRITLETGLGRGHSFGPWGDTVTGIAASGEAVNRGSFPGGVVIEENYLDFVLDFARGGFITNKGLEREPDYRPDLKNHETPVCVGITINRNLGKVIVRNNVIRNMNARGIVVTDNWETADIELVDNTIISEVFGAYPYNNPMSGVGIFVQSAWQDPRSGGRVKVSGNKIICDKVNYCGIAVYGPSKYQEGAGKLGECVVRDNDVHLGDGSIGVLIRKSDRTEVVDNKISGKAYYGFHFWGSRDREGFDLGSNANMIEDNDMTDLVIRAPDEYSDSHADGRMFTGTQGKSATAHVWLNNYSKDNVIKVKGDETVIDEGEDNTITYHDDE